MTDLKSSLSLANDKSSGLKSKCIGLGNGTIISAEESNITGIEDNCETYEICVSMLKTYKTILDTDADRIRDLGILFFEFDHGMAGKM